MAMVSKNGCALTTRTVFDGVTAPEILAESPPSATPFIALPINVMIIDASGRKWSHFIIDESEHGEAQLRRAVH